MNLEALTEKFRSFLGEEGVLAGDAVSDRVAGIWRQDRIAAPLLVRPRTTDEVAAVLRACYEAGQTVVTHGGLTGLAAGAIAGPADVVLSTEKLNAIEQVSKADRTMRLQAGVRLQDAQERAAEEGFMLGVDMGARGSCTIGGNIATNAGGHQVIRYGMTREAVLGLEAVLADGTVVSSMNEMLKNNAGYDLKQLFIGTEGTLGIVTRAVLRLRPPWRSQETALIACDEFAQVADLLNVLNEMLGGTLSSFEVMWGSFYELVIQGNDNPPLPGGFRYYVLAEALGGDRDSDRERFHAAMEQAVASGLHADAVVCKSGEERDAVWKLRDSVDRTLEFGEAFIFDVSLPMSRMEDYVSEVLAGLDAEVQGHRTWVFGHAGDGNLHFVVSPGKDTGARAKSEAAVYGPLQQIGGSISGEHGVGLEKKRWLNISRNQQEIALMRQLKSTLDPAGILNPGRIFDSQ